MTSVVMLIDPSVYVNHYFVLPREPGDLGRVALAEFLTQVVGEFAGQLGAEAPQVALRDFEAGDSERLAFVKGPDTGSPVVDLEIRSLHDALLLRMSAIYEGQFRADALPELGIPHLETLETHTVAQPVANYLGSLTAYAAEVKTLEQSKQSAGVLWQHAYGNSPSVRFATPIGDLHTAGRDHTLAAVFVFAQGDRRAHGAFLFALPEMALCRLKVVNSRQRINTGLDAARAATRTIETLTGNSQGRHQGLSEIKKRIDDLTTARAQLVECIVRVEAELRTIRVNRRNLAVALQGTAWNRPVEEGRRIRHALVDRLAKNVELQALTGLTYRKAALKQAEVHFDSLDATADYYQVSETRKLSRIVITLTSIQVAALLPLFCNKFTDWPWYGRMAAVASLATFLASAAIWLTSLRRR